MARTPSGAFCTTHPCEGSHAAFLHAEPSVVLGEAPADELWVQEAGLSYGIEPMASANPPSVMALIVFPPPRGPTSGVASVKTNPPSFR